MNDNRSAQPAAAQAFPSFASRLAAYWPTSLAPRRRRSTWQPRPRRA